MQRILLISALALNAFLVGVVVHQGSTIAEQRVVIHQLWKDLMNCQGMLVLGPNGNPK